MFARIDSVNSQKATGPAVGLYPHNMHPGLVPGISVEDQRNTFGLDKVTFFTTAALIVGPTLLLLNLIPSGIVTYVDQLLPMMAKGLSWGDDTVEFQSYWTAFYWAWWIAWTPFVGMFVARISRGRTLREFTAVTVLAPTTILILAFTIFGGTAIDFHRENLPGFDGSASGEQVLFDMFANLPLHQVTPFILLVVLAVFFITSTDSASVIMGTMSFKGDPAPNKAVVIFWGLCMMGIAIVMLLTGGEDVLTGLQNLTILSALPFCLVLLVMMVAFIKDLRSDPMFIRRTYARGGGECGAAWHRGARRQLRAVRRARRRRPRCRIRLRFLRAPLHRLVPAHRRVRRERGLRFRHRYLVGRLRPAG